MARPTKLKPDVAEAIVRLIEHAVHPEVAAGAFGISYRTYTEWLARGEGREDDDRPAEPIYVEFARDVRAAEYRAESALTGMAVGKIRTTRDALDVLARRFGVRWRERIDVHVELEAEVRRLAEETGVDYAEALAEAERILAESAR
jgi:hypothetical protein